MKRLRVVFACKLDDLTFRNSVAFADKALPDMKILEIEALR